MYKIHFSNAVVSDDGFGVTINGKSLEEIISIMLGTRVANKYGYNSGLPHFKSNGCNVTVIIDPQPSTVNIETPNGAWDSVKDMENDKNEQYQQEVEKAETEE